jgi:predicted DNA-binding ribbon-helix-helix protein
MMNKYSVTLDGHRTSISLEPEFWNVLNRMAEKQRCSVAGLIKTIDDTRTTGLSSAIRVYVLTHMSKKEVC